jgi:hypothetical protein
MTATTATATPFDALWDAPMSDRGHFRFDSHPTLVGRESGKLWIRAVRTIPGLGVTVTLQEDGRHYWRGRGEQGYAPAETFTILVEPDRPGRGASHRYVKISPITPVRTSEAERSDASTSNAATLAELLAGGQS